MQFIDLAAQQARIKDTIDRNIQTVLSHGKYIMGPEVNEVEQRLAEYAGARHGIACASGTDALLMALMAKGVGPGDMIFTSPFTFIATAEVISLLGATPVFVDIDPATFNIDPDKLELEIKNRKEKRGNRKEGRTRATGIITVDLFGLPCDYDRINAIAKKYDLFVIEDAAQSFGGEYKGKRAGCMGDISATSFFPAKPLGCYGDGGMCFTDDDHLAELMRSVRVHGKGNHKYDNARVGINGRLDTIQAAILNAKFDIFPEEIELRQKVAEIYTRLLKSKTTLVTPYIPEGYKSAWAQYSVLAKDAKARSEIQTALKTAGIPTAIYYPKPLHLQTAYADSGYKEGDFKFSEDASQRIFSIPMHPYLEESAQAEIVSHLVSCG